MDAQLATYGQRLRGCKQHAAGAARCDFASESFLRSTPSVAARHLSIGGSADFRPTQRICDEALRQCGREISGPWAKGAGLPDARCEWVRAAVRIRRERS